MQFLWFPKIMMVAIATWLSDRHPIFVLDLDKMDDFDLWRPISYLYKTARHKKDGSRESHLICSILSCLALIICNFRHIAKNDGYHDNEILTTCFSGSHGYHYFLRSTCCIHIFELKNDFILYTLNVSQLKLYRPFDKIMDFWPWPSKIWMTLTSDGQGHRFFG